MKNRMVNSVDPDETVSTGSTLCANVFVLICRVERLKKIRKHMNDKTGTWM